MVEFSWRRGRASSKFSITVLNWNGEGDEDTEGMH